MKSLKSITVYTQIHQVCEKILDLFKDIQNFKCKQIYSNKQGQNVAIDKKYILW